MSPSIHRALALIVCLYIAMAAAEQHFNPAAAVIGEHAQEIRERSRAYNLAVENYRLQTGIDVRDVVPRVVYIPMRDGVKLFTLVWDSHITNKKAGAVIDRSPYGPYATQNVAELYLPHGYVAIAQDERGTGKSGGASFGFWTYASNDSEDTMAWIKQQEWSNGDVYEVGASADGIITCLANMEKKPMLKGTWLMITTSIPYHTAYQDGAQRYGLMHNWLELMQAWRPNATSYWMQAQHLEGFNSHYQNLSWHEITLGPTQLKNIDYPSVFWAGWYDIFLQEQLTTFENYETLTSPGAQGKNMMFVGPRGHCFLGSEYPDDRMVAIWSYEESLKMFKADKDYLTRNDYATGSNTFSKYTLYVIGPQKEKKELLGGDDDRVGMYWTTLDTLPPTKPQLWYLGADKTLSLEHSSNSSVLEYDYDPKHPVPTNGGNNLFLKCGAQDQRGQEKRDDVLVFDTPVFTEDTAVCGRIRSTLHVSSNVTDTDFTVKITDVYPSGDSMLVGDDILRMRWRNGDVTPVLMQPGQPYQITIKMWMTCYVFNKGHKLRLAVSSSNYPRFSANLNNGKMCIDGGEALVAHNQIMVGGATASTLELPVVSLSDLPKNVKVA